MLSICMCLIMNGCTSKRNQQSWFLKKPLVAVSLLVIITMCLTLAEAAPHPAEHRRRHHRRQADSMPHRTKELSRHRNPSIEPYKNAIDAVIRRLNNNNRHYKDDLYQYKRIRRMRHIKGNPTWLPKVNFMAIHFHRSKNLTSRFKYIIPKLYKHIMEYRTIFELLNNVTVNFSSNLYAKLQNRTIFLNTTLTRLDQFIVDITDGLDSVQIPIPEFDSGDINLTDFHMIVDDTGLDYQDHYAFRGYENLLRYWKLEFRCWKKNPETEKNTCMCLEYHAEMIDRRNKVPKTQRTRVPKCEKNRKKLLNQKLKQRHEKRRRHQESS